MPARKPRMEAVAERPSAISPAADSPKPDHIPLPWRWTVHDYHKMGEIGILRHDDRVELIEGEIVTMPPIGHDHAGGTNRLNMLFAPQLGGRAIVSVQNPVRLSETSEPQPDLLLLRPEPAFYATRKAKPDDVLLLVEISDSTLRHDRDVKVPLYARAGIPEVWLLDLRNDRLRVYREPDEGEYRQVTVLTRGDKIAPLAFPDLTLTVDGLLGQRVGEGASAAPESRLPEPSPETQTDAHERAE